MYKRPTQASSVPTSSNTQDAYTRIRALFKKSSALEKDDFNQQVSNLYHKIKKQEHLLSIMHTAIKYSAWDCLVDMITINETNRIKMDYGSVLVEACSKIGVTFDVIATLLQAGAPLHATRENISCLELALKTKNYSVVEGLVNYEITKRKKNKPSFNYEVILLNEIHNQGTPVVIAPLLNGANKKAAVGKFSGSFLHEAVRANRVDLFSTLVGGGVSLHQTEKNHLRRFQGGLETPLDLARRQRDLNPESYKALLKIQHETAPVSLTKHDIFSLIILQNKPLQEIRNFLNDIQEQVPQDGIGLDSRWLHFALKSGRQDIPALLELLIEYKASCAATDRDGKTAAVYAVENGMDKEFFALVKAVEGTQAQLNGFETALFMILKSQREDKISLSLEVLQLTNYQGNPNPIDPHKVIPYVIRSKNEDLILQFLKLFPIPFTFPIDNFSLLELACFGRFWKVVEAILPLEVSAPSPLQNLSFVHTKVKSLMVPEIANMLQRAFFRAIKGNAPSSTIESLLRTKFYDHLPFSTKRYYFKGEQNTISHYIVLNNRIELIRVLLEFFRSDLDKMNAEGLTPTALAIKMELWDFIEGLVPFIENKSRWSLFQLPANILNRRDQCTEAYKMDKDLKKDFNEENLNKSQRMTVILDRNEEKFETFAPMCAVRQRTEGLQESHQSAENSL